MIDGRAEIRGSGVLQGRQRGDKGISVLAVREQGHATGMCRVRVRGGCRGRGVRTEGRRREGEVGIGRKAEEWEVGTNRGGACTAGNPRIGEGGRHAR